MKKMILGKPYISYPGGGRVRLNVKVIREGMEDFDLFYEFEDKYEPYLCIEVLDPFVVAVVPYAMEFGYDLYSEQAISDEIFYSLVNDFIPVCSQFLPFFSPVKLNFEQVINYQHASGKAVGTGVSCGVDSLYTILAHHKNSDVPESHQLTHLVLMNAGSCSWKGGEESYQWFDVERLQAKKLCEELSLSFVSIHTDLMEFYGVDHSHSGTMRMAGCVLAIDKLFGRYYLASGYNLDQFKFTNDDAAYAFFSLRCVSTKNTAFHLTGNSKDRDQRVRYISDSSVAKRYLNVCWNGAHNCGKCEKCLRTMGSLYSIDRLECFDAVFDVKEFEKHKASRIAKMIFYSKDHKSLYGFLNEINRKDSQLYFKAWCICLFWIIPANVLKIGVKRIIKPDSKLYLKCKAILKR